MNMRLANPGATTAIALTVLIASSISAPAAAQGFLDSARSLLGVEAKPTTSDLEHNTDLELAHDTNLTGDEIGTGLREALRIAAGAVVGQLGAPDGFNADAAVHIPLPQPLGKFQSIMERTGFGAQFEQLELRLNRAAEIAVGRTGELLVSAIDDMTLEDAMQIYRGPDDAATQYFSRKMSESLAAEMRPIVEESLNDVGAAKALARVIDQYHALPLSREVDTDLTSYVVEKGLDGIFHYMAQQEAAIRHDPLKHSSDLLRRLFEN